MLKLILLVATFAAVHGAAQPVTPPEEFSANYLNVSNVGATGATPVTIRITRWTSDEEDVKLMELLRAKGSQAFVRGLQDAKTVGSIGVPQSLPLQLFYARQLPAADGSRRIVLAGDRQMSFEERTGSSVARDYPLTWIQIQVTKEGRGEGTMALAARLRLVGNFLGVEDLANQPVRLADIRRIVR